MNKDESPGSNYTIALEMIYYNFSTNEKSNLRQNNITTLMKVGVKMYSYVIPLFGFFIITINLAVIISSILLLKKGQQPRNVYIFLGNVSLADLFTGIEVVLGSTYPKEARSIIMCDIILGMITGTSVVSVASVTLIAIDRYIYIIHGINYKRWLYLRRVAILIVSSWIIGLSIGVLPAISSRRNTNHGKFCWFILYPPEIILISTLTALMIISVSCVLYCIILYHALKKVQQLKNMSSMNPSTSSKLRAFRGNTNTARNGIQMKSESEKIEKQNSPSTWKAIRVVLFTTGGVLITWVPYGISCILYVFCNKLASDRSCERLKYAIVSPLAILGFMNSLFNPIIYAWWHDGFRKGIKKMYQKHKTKFVPNIFSISRDNL